MTVFRAISPALRQARDARREADVNETAGNPLDDVGARSPADRTRPSPMDTPTLCPILVGREASLATTLSFGERSLGGHGGTLLISGEAGIGKSRLVIETISNLCQPGHSPAILRGQCFEQDRSMPFAPLVDLLRAWLESTNPQTVADALAPIAADVSLLLPELKMLFPTSNQPTPARNLEVDKRRLIHSLVHLLADTVAARPALVVVEDVHWADGATLEFLLQLARRARGRPLSVLVTYRSEDTSPGLQHFLASLDRERLASEITLGPLSVTDVDEMLRKTFSQQWPVRSEFLHAMWHLTEGNPFFIEEVLKSLVSSGDIFYRYPSWNRKVMSEIRIPRSVRDAVHVRIQPLSVAARRLLELAAVAGRSFDFMLLQQATGQTEEELLALVKELIAAQLVVEEGNDRFAFRHALTRESIYDELLARERLILHRTIAKTLRQLAAPATDRHITDLAYHSYAGGDWEEAAAYCRRAGERAMALYAPEAAIELFSQALDARARAGLEPLADVLRSRGRCHELVGDFDAARHDFEAVLAAVTAGDPGQEWQALLDLGVLWSGRDYHQGGRYHERAYDVARVSGAQAAVAHSLNFIGNWRLRTERSAEARACHRQALAIFEELDDRPGIAETLSLLGMADHVNGRLTDAATSFRRAIDVAGETDNRQALVFSLATSAVGGLAYHSDLVVPAVSQADSALDGEAAVQLARDIGWRAGEAYALLRLGSCLGAQGDYGRALGAATRALAIAEEIEHRQWMAAAGCSLGALYLDLLDLDLAEQHLERARALSLEIGSSYWYRASAGHLAQARMARNDLSRADAILTEAVSQNTPIDTLAQRVVWEARAELDMHQGDPERALGNVHKLIAASGSDEPVPRLACLLARVLTALNRTAHVAPLLSRAASVADQHGARPMLWRIHALLAEHARADGDEDRSRAHLHMALTVVHTLAGTIDDPEMRGLYLERMAGDLPHREAAGGRNDQPRVASELTAREREVASLVASGRSNRAIADHLVVSERTVESHVSNILSKLEFSSRAQIAAWVVRAELSDAPPSIVQHT